MSARERGLVERVVTFVVRGLCVLLLVSAALNLNSAFGARGERVQEETVAGWYDSPASRPLADGDCIEGLTRDTWTIVDCARPHRGEVAGEVRVRTDEFTSYPGDALTPVAAERCMPVVSDYAGGIPADLGLGYTSIHPSPDTWLEGDRSVWCVLVAGDSDGEATLTGSVRAG